MGNLEHVGPLRLEVHSLRAKAWLHQQGGMAGQAGLQPPHPLQQHPHSHPAQHHVCQPHYTLELADINGQRLQAGSATHVDSLHGLVNWAAGSRS